MQQMYSCPRCSAQITFGTSFCPNCGQPFSWPAQPQQQPPPAYQQPYEQQYRREGGQPEQKKKSPWLIGCLGLIVLGVLIGIIMAVAFNGSESPSSAPQTETSVPALTASEQLYAATIADHSARVGEAFGEFSNLMSEPKLGDDEWTIRVAVQLVTIKALYDEAMEIDPPSSMAAIHYKYVQAMNHYDTATDLIVKGIDTLNSDLINDAVDEINLGNQLIREATRLTNEFVASHSQ